MTAAVLAQPFLPSGWRGRVALGAGASMHGSLPSEPLPLTPCVAATREWAGAFAAPGRKKGRECPGHGVSVPVDESPRMRTR